MGSEVLGDYCDGSLFQTHPLFSVEPHALQIMLYFDELEVCNPLGSSAKVHKLGVFMLAYICKSLLTCTQGRTLVVLETPLGCQIQYSLH